jgi:hypothetical protein
VEPGRYIIEEMTTLLAFDIFVFASEGIYIHKTSVRNEHFHRKVPLVLRKKEVEERAFFSLEVINHCSQAREILMEKGHKYSEKSVMKFFNILEVTNMTSVHILILCITCLR